MQEKITSLADAIALVSDGDVVALQNMATQAAPMTLVRELIRQNKRALGLVVLVGGGLTQRRNPTVAEMKAVTAQ